MRNLLRVRQTLEGVPGARVSPALRHGPGEPAAN
jgi:hypothetical protein